MSGPVLGLVCQTVSDAIRYRTITRTRLLALEAAQRQPTLRELYRDNIGRLDAAISYCQAQGIGLYRVPSGMLPFVDHELGRGLLQRRDIASALRAAGARARAAGIRLVTHPDQFVVLNSERDEVCRNSRTMLAGQAAVLDALGLPRSPFAAITIHGGKSGRGDALTAAVRALPDGVRSRIVLENDERAYGAHDILAICRSAGVPMVFDAHHHLVKETLASYAHPSIAHMTNAAAATWPDPRHQLVHVSNGRERLHDSRHSEMIDAMPPAFRAVPYVEVEAKAKELALRDLTEWFPQRTESGRTPR